MAQRVDKLFLPTMGEMGTCNELNDSKQDYKNMPSPAPLTPVNH